MSLILDALNRSRDDSDSVPGLATRHEYGGDSVRRSSLLLGLLLLVALVVIAWLVWDRPQSAPEAGGPETQVADTRAQPVPTVAPIIASVPATQPASSPPDVPVAPESAVTLSAPVRPDSGAYEANAASGDSLPAVGGDAVAPEVAALYASAGDAETSAARTATVSPAPAQRPLAPEPRANSAAEPAPAAVVQREERELDIGQLVDQAESELQDARLTEHPAPFINELSQQSKDAIPTVYYQRHAYSGRSAESRVVLNGKPLPVGGSPVSGMRVEEILPDSVVLNYDGTQFRLRALNSWVNL